MSAEAARQALEAANRLQVWLDETIGFVSDRPQYANPGELKKDLRFVLAALREQASPDAALIEALERIQQELGVPGDGYPAPVANAWEIADAALAAARAGETPA